MLKVSELIVRALIHNLTDWRQTCEIWQTKQNQRELNTELSMHMPPPFRTISGLVMILISDLLTSFCSKLQQHIQINSNYHHTMFCSDMMSFKVDIWPHWSSRELDLRSFDLKSNQFISVPRRTTVVNLVKFIQQIYRNIVLTNCLRTNTYAWTDNAKT